MFYHRLDVRRPLHFPAPLRGQRPGPSRTRFRTLFAIRVLLQLSMKRAKQMHQICSHFCSLHICFTYLELMILLFSFISFPKYDIHTLAILNPEALFRVSNSSYFRLRSFVSYLPFDSRRFLDERTRTAAPSSFLQKAAVRSCSRAPQYPMMISKLYKTLSMSLKSLKSRTQSLSVAAFDNFPHLLNTPAFKSFSHMCLRTAYKMSVQMQSFEKLLTFA